jgi:hypothetical protein
MIRQVLPLPIAITSAGKAGSPDCVYPKNSSGQDEVTR